jgi:hypothetical protein
MDPGMQQSIGRPLSRISNHTLDIPIPPGTYPPNTILNVNGIEAIVERYIAEGTYLPILKEDLRMYTSFGLLPSRQDWC